MVGLAVISHGAMCRGIMDSAGMIVGEIENAVTVSLEPGMSPDTYREMLKGRVEHLDAGEGVLILCDIMGGTPFNLAAMLAKDMHVAIVAGMNLPMLINVALSRGSGSTLEELAKVAIQTAQEGIRVFRIDK